MYNYPKLYYRYPMIDKGTNKYTHQKNVNIIKSLNGNKNIFIPRCKAFIFTPLKPTES